VRRCLLTFFGEGKQLREIEPVDGDRFRTWLKDHEKLSDATTARRITSARQMFKRACKWRLIVENLGLDVAVGRQRSSFYVKGDGTSPRVLELTDEERNVALEQAARYAAVDAAERITPRRVRESILLDDTAPAFDEGFARIDVGEYADARKIWERALAGTPRSPALHFNLAAVCEALGDRKEAELHYVAARQLAPAEGRYVSELRSFLRRTKP
jgi:tetratricopeptide (TPR) repeat protein